MKDIIGAFGTMLALILIASLCEYAANKIFPALGERVLIERVMDKIEGKE